MPTYSYECKKCAHVRDVYHSMSVDPIVKCDDCGASMRRLIGAGAGIIFKGTGFYETDYKTKNGSSKGGHGAGKENGAPKSESKSGDKAESKSSEKSESKTSPKPESSSSKSN